MIVLLTITVDSRGARVTFIRYVPVWVRHPDYEVLPAGIAWRTDPADAAALRASYERTVAVAGRGPDIQPIPAHLLHKAGKRPPRDAAPGEIEAVAAVMAGPAGLTLGNTDAAAASLAHAERLAAGPVPGRYANAR